MCSSDLHDKKRLDIFLASKLQSIRPELSRRKIQNIIESGNIELQNSNNQRNVILSSQKINCGEVYIIKIPPNKPMQLDAQKIDFDVIFEDEHLLIINKPANLTVHPGPGNQSNTLVNGLLYRFKNNLSSINGDFRPGIVHRLDKDTSGLMLVAKNDLTHQILSKMLEEHQIKRLYLAIIYGVMDPESGVIDKNITRSTYNRLKMTTSKTKGRKAVTNYRTLEVMNEDFASIIECRLETGRTHQIRAHLESEKHSLIGDQIYNSCKKQPPFDHDKDAFAFINKFPRQALHSYKIELTHPITKEEIRFEISLADDLKELCQNIRKL